MISFGQKIAVACLLMSAAVCASAQAYPVKPIRLIVGFAPGGATDMVARIWADAAGKELGQPVVVDNRSGAGGAIGAIAVAKSPADGYTLGLATVGSHATNVACNPRGGYDPIKDFTPISNLARTPNVLVMNHEVPAQNFAELKSYISRKPPGSVRYATGGSCGVHHLTGAMFASLIGSDLTHVPYRGSGPALTDLLGGQLELFFDSMPGSIQAIQGKRVRPVAVAWPARLATLPEVPTYSELGLGAINDSVWYGLVAPANLPPDIQARLNAVSKKVMQLPSVQARIVQTGSEPVWTTPEEFGAEIKKALDRFRSVVQSQNIKLDPNSN
jgi:tripartite-type tricarboxylate transporter receptor subunit TctC